jgi:hypothetical protein
MKAEGINAELLVLDWPTALQKSVSDSTGWNFFFTGWVTVVALGGAQSLSNLSDPYDVDHPDTPKGRAWSCCRRIATACVRRCPKRRGRRCWRCGRRAARRGMA